jgi:hypothetical protein
VKNTNAKPAGFLAAAAISLITSMSATSWAISCEGSFVEQTQSEQTRADRMRQTMRNLWHMRATRSRDQVLPVTPAIATLAQFKSALATDTSALRNANYRAGENPSIESFLKDNLLSLYQMIGRDGRELISLIRISGTPVTENRIADYRGETILQTDAPEKIVATVLRLNNAEFSPETSVSEIAHNLNLNPRYTTIKDGILMVEERSGSTSGMGAHDPGVHQPGLWPIKEGKVAGFSVAPLSHDNHLSQGSVWGGRYSTTTVSAIVPMDAARYAAARNNLGNQLVEINLQVLAATRITDPNLNQWLDSVSKFSLESMPWYKATTSGSTVENLVMKGYERQPAEFKTALVRHLYTRRILNLKPVELFQHKSSSNEKFYLDGSIAENISQRGKPVDTVSRFPKDLPFIRSGIGNNTLEVFGHLRATDRPAAEMNAEAVQAYIRKNVPEVFQRNAEVVITDIVITNEGQFSANVMVKAPVSLLRRLLGRETN